ncbi:MAG: hypothetical protein ACRC4M_04080 [Mycoplasma sp.]
MEAPKIKMSFENNLTIIENISPAMVLNEEAVPLDYVLIKLSSAKILILPAGDRINKFLTLSDDNTYSYVAPKGVNFLLLDTEEKVYWKNGKRIPPSEVNLKDPTIKPSLKRINLYQEKTPESINTSPKNSQETLLFKNTTKAGFSKTTKSLFINDLNKKLIWGPFQDVENKNYTNNTFSIVGFYLNQNKKEILYFVKVPFNNLINQNNKINLVISPTTKSLPYTTGFPVDKKMIQKIINETTFKPDLEKSEDEKCLTMIKDEIVTLLNKQQQYPKDIGQITTEILNLIDQNPELKTQIQATINSNVETKTTTPPKTNYNFKKQTTLS